MVGLEQRVNGDAGGMPRKLAFLFPVALLIVVQVLFVAFEISPVPLKEGVLGGTDSYMRLVRAETLYETGNWYDSVSHRSNAPDGEVLHWTRPMDVLLIAGAVVLAPFLGFHLGLFWWGALISPILHIAALLLLMWAARPVVAREHLVYLGVLTISQPGILGYFSAGRPDHHSLFGLLFVVLVGFMLRLLGRAADWRPAVAAGAAAAGLLWVSVEGLLAVAVVIAAAGLGWIAGLAGFTRKSVAFAVTVAAGTALALLVERPPHDLLTPEYDRLSIVHPFVLGLVALFWLVVAAIERSGPLLGNLARRFGLAGCGAILAAFAAWLVYPKFFASPLVDIDPQVYDLWVGNITELRPIVVAGDPPQSLRRLIFMLGPALAALPFLVHRLWRLRGAAEALPWVGVAIGLAGYIPLAAFQVRFVPYAEIVSMVPYAALLGATLAALDRRAAGGDPAAVAALPSGQRAARAATRALIIVGFAVWFMIVASLILRFELPAEAEETPDCPLYDMTLHLAEADGLGAQPRRIMSFVFFGPEIIYRSPHDVVGTPYHRNTAGILDTFRFFTAEDDATPHEIATRRGVGLVLVCVFDAEAERYRRESEDAFYHRIEDGPLPAWLDPVTLPEGLAEPFRLFRVVD